MCIYSYDELNNLHTKIINIYVVIAETSFYTMLLKHFLHCFKISPVKFGSTDIYENTVRLRRAYRKTISEQILQI